MKKNKSAKVKKDSDKFIDSKLCLQLMEDLLQCNGFDQQMMCFVQGCLDYFPAKAGTVFINNPERNELVSRHLQGSEVVSIRMVNNKGIVGHVYQTGECFLSHDAYKDDIFDSSSDKRNKVKTKTVIAVPMLTRTGEVIGVVEIINKKKSRFTQKDLHVLTNLTQIFSLAVASDVIVEQNVVEREREEKFLKLLIDISSEIELLPILNKIIAVVSDILDAERATIFLHDDKTNELYTMVGQGIDQTEIRIPDDAGIAGSVFQQQETLNIPHAYADLRFNPAVDKKTGFFTRSILCAPLFNKQKKIIGVTQVLNKQGGSFKESDIDRLSAFSSEISVSLENAKLFDDVYRVKKYNESMLQSMSNTVLTFDNELKIITCNTAGLDFFAIENSKGLRDTTLNDLFDKDDQKVIEVVYNELAKGDSNRLQDVSLHISDKLKSANISISRLLDAKDNVIGGMLVIEDITAEMRVKSTMSRYMDPVLAQELLASDDDVLGGKNVKASVLFTDIRSFTTISEQLGAQDTVTLLNDYFTVMVDCVADEGGTLDKFIGDAMMVLFGSPVEYPDSSDRAVRSAIAMMRGLYDFNQQQQSEEKMTIDHGIGIHTGKVICGNIGSPKRMDFTSIGDGVNLASRVEGACKFYGANIIVTDATLKDLHSSYRYRHLDRLTVKGKTKPVDIYEILDFHTAESFPHIAQVVQTFNDAVELYHAMEWDKATTLFQKVLQLRADDKVSKVYIERCQTLKDNPPQDWDGVWHMTTK